MAALLAQMFQAIIVAGVCEFGGAVLLCAPSPIITSPLSSAKLLLSSLAGAH